MIFFTRELFLGGQPDSGWERRAHNEWQRRLKFYTRYHKLIEPMLPAAVRRLCNQSLHDGKVCEVSLKGEELTFLIDVTHALSGFRGPMVRLTFGGVKNRPCIPKLIGQDWLYEEAHLCSRAMFNLQVLFDDDELEIEADELVIKQLPYATRADR